MLKKITSKQLLVGMYIQKLGSSWMEHSFWRKRFLLDDANDIQRVIESGITEVWIDTTKGRDLPRDSALATTPNDTEEVQIAEAALQAAPTAKVATEAVRIGTEQEIHAKEITRAAKICAQGKAAVISMFQDIRMGRTVSAKAAEELVDEISASVMRNPGALISLARLKTADDYTYMHSVAVCALMVALARQWEGIDEATTRELGMAGLLHDLGKALTPPEVLNKPGKLTDEEFMLVKQHPAKGHRLLLDSSNVGEIPLDVVLHHHEKMDGTGYPYRLRGDEISLYARMGAVCDVYDAITSNRPYKTGWDPGQSIRKMAEWCPSHFDDKVFKAFVKSLGIYPIGSLVQLASGRLAVVVEQTEQSLVVPKVKVFFSTSANGYILPEVIDLSRPRQKEKIVSCASAEAWGLKNIDQFLVL
ncbi:MAG: HD-GYP domain-containing protein [Rugosibacter sp.]|nr:HD-GYP domain-containing protein [Rugosibacter sp.]